MSLFPLLARSTRVCVGPWILKVMTLSYLMIACMGTSTVDLMADLRALGDGVNSETGSQT